MIEYEEIVNFIQKSCLLLDEENFEGFLNICNENFEYKITAFSPEINKEMIWMDEDYAGFKNLLMMVSSHLRRLGKLTRNVSIGQIQRESEKIFINSSFIVIHTDLEGKSNIFCVGRYKDVIISHKGSIQLESRHVHLETRDLGIGSHVPI